VINAINKMEFAKKALQQAVSYSFYKSSLDVLTKGGFCAYDESLCDEGCKIPKSVPTLKCKPWWRIYGSEPAPNPNEFVSYLVNRTSAIYDDYSGPFYGPAYCPQPPGAVTVEDAGAYSVSVGVTNTESGVIEYKSEDIDIVEYTVNFSDTFTSTALELFKFARDEFVDKNKVKQDFNDAHDAMPNDWCEEVLGGYCNVTVDCGNAPYYDTCFGGSGPSSNCCWEGEDCCCRKIYFGNKCEPDIGDDKTGFCESGLPPYCSKNDETAYNAEECNFNHNNEITANEKYNCTVQEKLKEPVEKDDVLIGAIQLKNGDFECIKIDHDADFDGTLVGFENERWDEDCGCRPNHWEIDCDDDPFATPCDQLGSSSSCGYKETNP